MENDMSSSLLLGDYIGMESCFDMVGTDEDLFSPKEEETEGESSDCRCKREGMGEMRETREFPPPIPLLARTGNLHPHMPWVLKRHYTSDGRLILTEERVKHHEYFQARRENGRLTLQLVPLDVETGDDDNAGVYSDDESQTEEEAEEDEEFEQQRDGDVEDAALAEEMAKLSLSVSDSSSDGGSGGFSGNGGGKCYSTPGCIFRISVPAIRPVHS